jgi:membrane peptidoglycan carboxypeptidase
LTNTRLLVKRRRDRRQQLRSGIRLALSRLLTVFLSLVGVLLLLLLTGIGSAISAYGYYAQDLPEPGQIQLVEQEFATVKIYDRTGTILLYEIVDPTGGDRTWMELADIPQSLSDATIAIEDKTFYTNPGYDTEGIARALWNNFTGGTIQGGSSITQQLVKNVLIDPEQRTEISYDRKIRELILAIQISRTYSKDQILEWYLNTNFYGNLAYGVEAASQVYFGKPVSELTLAESAMLAAIPQSPALNPIDNYDLAKERQRVVLDLMVEQELITQQEADIAFETPLTIKPPEDRFDILAPHFSIAARQQLEEIIEPGTLHKGGLVVYTTLDYDLYLQAECTARSHVARLSGQSPATVIPAADGSPCDAAQYLPSLAPQEQNIDHHVGNAAIMITNPRTGEVLAMVGSLDYHNAAINGNYNVATAARQPGSAFKPFTYLTAFQQGYTPATMTLDVRTAFNVGSNNPYVPENVDRQFHGPQSIRNALANSYNVPAVQVLQLVGIDSALRTAHAMGINTLDRGVDQYGLSLTLGGGEVTLYDLTYAYGTFANMGEMRGRPVPEDKRRPGFRTLDPTLILRVEDRDGKIIWEYGKHNTFASNTVVDPALVYLVNDILADETARQPSMGAGSALLLSRPAAVKTGTTNDYRDNLAVGYTPQIVTGVWVGNTDNTPMIEMPAITGAAPIWHAVMEYALRDLPIETWQRPENIVQRTVCQPSGLLPTAYCPTKQELFVLGTEPTTYDNIFQVFQINRETGLLATVYTPPEKIEERVYQILPAEAADWVREQGIPQPPTEYDTVSAPTTLGPVVISEPLPFSYVKGAVSIKGNATDPYFRLFRIAYGEGLNPTDWLQIGQDNFSPISGNKELGIWDARMLDGLYSLRLTVMRGNNSLVEQIIQVTVDNTPPQIQILTPTNEQNFSLDDEFVIIQPLVADNISMSKVEFYVDDQLIATSTIAPFNERWIFSEPGVHYIQLRAYDAAGNTTVSERVKITVTP